MAPAQRRGWIPIGLAAALLAAALIGTALSYEDARAAAPQEEQTVADPRVLTPPPPPDFGRQVEAAIERFRPIYIKHGAPRIAIYWNREMTDRLSDWQTERRTIEVTRQGNGALARTQEVMKFDQSVARDAQRKALQDGWQWEFQEGFLYPLSRVGVRVVDRAAIQRLIAIGVRSGPTLADGLDRQALELRALQRYADLWAEVLMTPAEDSPTGVELRVVVKHVTTGEIVAHSTGGSLGGQPAGYVATARGFERRAPTPPSPREIAARLAIDMMDSLADKWAR